MCQSPQRDDRGKLVALSRSVSEGYHPEMSSIDEARSLGQGSPGQFVVAVAGRRGGLAATALATDLAVLFAESERRTALVDADAVVPAVSARLDIVWEEETRVGGMGLEIDSARCQRCGACSDFCAFESLAFLPEGIRYTPDRCVACGGCRKVCPSGAISERQRFLGMLRRGSAGPHLFVLEAELAPDAQPWYAAMAAWLRQSARGFPVQIVRAVPGMGRASREAWRNADIVLWLDDRPPEDPTDPIAVPGIESSRIVSIRSRVPLVPSFSTPAGDTAEAFRFPESAEQASALAHTGRLLTTPGPWAETVHAVFSRLRSALPAGTTSGEIRR